MGNSENTRVVMGNEKEQFAYMSPPEQLEPIHRWHDELEGSNKILAFELMNQVMEGKITNKAALALLENKSD